MQYGRFQFFGSILWSTSTPYLVPRLTSYTFFPLPLIVETAGSALQENNNLRNVFHNPLQNINVPVTKG